ncbi:MAG: hypothetical protein K6D94_01405 [Clostridiales bacterium]|nr:hypothetical protein [Clostridiales bacterium]
MLFTNTRLGSFAKDPAVEKFNGRYWLYYTVMQHDLKRIGVGIAVSEDMERWEDMGEMELTQECEKNGVGAPAAVVLGGRLHLFYQTYGNGRLDAICHAVTDDGTSFEKDGTNPVFRPTDDWCCGRAIDADVVVREDRLMLYFATRDHEMKIQKLGCAYAAIDSCFSRSDFRQAVIGSVLAPELKWEQQCIEAPAAVAAGGKIYMFYGGAYNCSPQQIGCAVSSDGIHFDRISGEPFFRCGAPGSWNASESGHPYAFRDDDGRVYLFFQGSPNNGRNWYISRMEIDFGSDGMPFVKKVFDGAE